MYILLCQSHRVGFQSRIIRFACIKFYPLPMVQQSHEVQSKSYSFLFTDISYREPLRPGFWPAKVDLKVQDKGARQSEIQH